MPTRSHLQISERSHKACPGLRALCLRCPLPIPNNGTPERIVRDPVHRPNSARISIPKTGTKYVVSATGWWTTSSRVFRRSAREPCGGRCPRLIRERLRFPLPVEPIGPDAAYEDFRRYVNPYPRGNAHPRFWGWVNGSGLPLGVFADLLAAAMNSSVGAFENAATLVEEQVLDWLKEMLGFHPPPVRC